MMISFYILDSGLDNELDHTRSVLLKTIPVWSEQSVVAPQNKTVKSHQLKRVFWEESKWG
jgi:hypothetical protein